MMHIKNKTNVYWYHNEPLIQKKVLDHFKLAINKETFTYSGVKA